MELLCEEITEEIIGSAFEVWKELGYGFLESVYKRAMKAELELRGLKAETEVKIKVSYKGIPVGDFQADLLVNGVVLVELKVAPECNSRDEAQLINELKATGIKVGLLINFGRRRAEFRRLVF